MKQIITTVIILMLASIGANAQSIADPKEKGECVGWTKGFDSWAKEDERPFSSTREACGRENSNRQKDFGTLSGADFHPSNTSSAFGNERKSSSNCTAKVIAYTSKARR